jgi:uncharacterized metal-binding protein
MRPGFGFGGEASLQPADEAPEGARGVKPTAPAETVREPVNCLTCADRICLRGETCNPAVLEPLNGVAPDVLQTLEVATDISSEEDRQLCRLAELVYFCLEMDYHRVGIAFCEDLREPAAVLGGVLERSFETIPVSCKVGGPPEPAKTNDAGDAGNGAVVTPVSCNPVAQARLLNHAGTDLNVIVGLCMGADCVFTQASDAPVTTLFVKDRSLANNPIGAVYSEYYLRESVTTKRPGTATESTGPEEIAPDRPLERHSAREEAS